MTVKYKTEGKLTLNGNSVNAPTVVVLWEVDGQHVRLVSDKHTITLSQNQLAELTNNLHTIWDDIGPIKAPKAAPEVPMPSGPMNIAFGGFPK